MIRAYTHWAGGSPAPAIPMTLSTEAVPQAGDILMYDEEQELEVWVRRVYWTIEESGSSRFLVPNLVLGPHPPRQGVV